MHDTDTRDAASRLAALDWPDAEQCLERDGYVVLPGLLAPDECQALIAGYDDAARFRSRVVMGRHGFGRGEYKYFAYPLPTLVEEWRQAFYPYLAPLASRWNAAMGVDVRYPVSLTLFLQRCHAAGQRLPTPLLLSYGPGDFNCLHQDLYGPHVFPLQVAFLLSTPQQDFTGGEFVLTTQRPRMQSKADVVPLQRGDAIAFAVHQRPVPGARGYYRVSQRHGVSTVRSGRRHTLGIIFHDAQ